MTHAWQKFNKFQVTKADLTDNLHPKMSSFSGPYPTPTLKGLLKHWHYFISFMFSLFQEQKISLQLLRMEFHSLVQFKDFSQVPFFLLKCR